MCHKVKNIYIYSFYISKRFIHFIFQRDLFILYFKEIYSFYISKRFIHFIFQRDLFILYFKEIYSFYISKRFIHFIFQRDLFILYFKEIYSFDISKRFIHLIFQRDLFILYFKEIYSFYISKRFIHLIFQRDLFCRVYSLRSRDVPDQAFCITAARPSNIFSTQSSEGRLGGPMLGEDPVDFTIGTPFVPKMSMVNNIIEQYQ